MSVIRALCVTTAILALGSCATTPRPIPRHCGAGFTWDHPGLESGSRLPACTLPTPKRVAQACAYAAVSNDGTGEYLFPPSYQVRDLRCRYAPGDRSRARCSFWIRQLAGDEDDHPDRPITPWRPAEASFSYLYYINGDGEGHVVSGAQWDVDAKCRPSGPKGELL